jgi:hypothetical protein
MSALLTVPPFDYGSVPAVETAALRAQAERIRKSNRSVMATILQIGRELIDVKARLPHGQFGLWVEAECGLAARTAEQYMSVAKLAEGKTATVAHLTPTLAYRLAPKSAAPDIVNEVLERAGKGEMLDQREVEDKLRDARNQKKYEAQNKSTPKKSSARVGPSPSLTRCELAVEREIKKAIDDLAPHEHPILSARLKRLVEQLLGVPAQPSKVGIAKEIARQHADKAKETQSPSTVPPASPSIATAPSAEMPDIPALLDRRLQQAKAETA